MTDEKVAIVINKHWKNLRDFLIRDWSLFSCAAPFWVLEIKVSAFQANWETSKHLHQVFNLNYESRLSIKGVDGMKLAIKYLWFLIKTHPYERVPI